MSRPSSSVCRFYRDSNGAAAVEFAILVPVYLLLVFGMLAYALYFGAAHSLQQLAADAARTAVAGLNMNERNSLVATFIANNAGGYVLIDAADLSYEITGNADDPNQYRVILRYNAAKLPIWNLGVPLPMPNQTIVYASSIRMGGI